MKWTVDGIGKLLIGGNGQKHVGCLYRNLEFMEIVILQDARMFQRRFNERLGTWFGIFFQKMLFQRAGIDADPHRTAMVARRADHLPNTVGPTDIAGIDPQTGGAGGGGLDGAAIMKVNVGDDRHRTCRTDFTQRRGAVLVGA